MILEKLQSLIADQLGVDGNTITMDTNFEEDLGVDSLDIVELSMALEELSLIHISEPTRP